MGGGGRLIANLPALMPLRTSVLNSGPFPRPALPGVLGTTGLSATPLGPACPSRASRLGVTRLHRRGLPVLRRFSVCQTCRRQYPGGTTGSCRFARRDPPVPQRRRPSPMSTAGRLPRSDFRGLLGVHSRYGLPTRRVAGATRCLEGFGGFVTSTAAPIASGWSDDVVKNLAKPTAPGRSQTADRRSGTRYGCLPHRSRSV